LRYSVDEGKNGKPVISFLERQDYIENFGFQHDRNNPNNSYQSRMRATPKLINLIIDQYKVSEDMIEHDVSDDETIVVKGVKPKPKYVFVIENGKKKKKKVKRPRRVCKTPDKTVVREMRKNLEIINEVMKKAEITLNISDDELRKLNARMLNDPDPYKQAVDFSRKRLHRVFVDRRLDRGGRFYGPWYQNIPKEYRRYILIDGAHALELDYSALHPNLLYYYAGADPPKGDLYELEGYSKDTRKFLKAMFLRMINSASKADAKGSIREAAFLKGKIAVPEELGNLEDKYLDPLLDKFIEKHEPIQDYLFKEYGNYLQFVDSTIAEDVLLYFAKKGLPVLPLHDSFRIAASLFQELREVMHKVIFKSYKQTIQISNDELSPLINNMLREYYKEIESADNEEERFKIQMKFEDEVEKLEEIKEKYLAN
jgi:hypothetical protein